jgi:precorrin-3B synthase
MKRGWCPTLYEPMPTGDGLLVRVKPYGARMTSSAARSLAEAAARFGNGVIELTSRGNWQVRGLTAASAPRFAGAMAAAGLASADPDIERRRNVIASPLAGDDPATAADAGLLAGAIEAMLAEPGDWDLPAKFGFAVDGGGVLPLSSPADIVVRTDGQRHWIGIGDAYAGCDPAATMSILHALTAAAAGRRMAEWVREAGITTVFATAGLVAEHAPARADPPTPVGFIPYDGADTGAFGLAFPFGQADAATLDTLATLAERFSDGTLRVTPWRAVLLGRVLEGDAAALRASAGGLIADPADPRLRMAACIGSAGCASGTVRARDDAAALANAGWTGFLHVSGCAKGCAYPGVADTLVGEGGSYGLVRNGRASDVPVASGLSLQQAAGRL